MHAAGPARTAVAAAVAAATLAACVDDSPTTERPSPTATAAPPAATATPVPSEPSEPPSPSPTPTPGRSARPTPSAPTPGPGPAPDDDGCPPARADRAAPPPTAQQVPSTDRRRVTAAPSGRPVDVVLVTVSTPGPAGARITATVEEHVRGLVARWDGTVGPPGADRDDATPPPELEVRLRPARVDRTVVSLVLEGYDYRGGASGTTLADGLVFSSATGEQLSLREVGLGGPCGDELGHLAGEALSAQDAGLYDQAAAGLRAGRIPPAGWSLHEDELHLYFPAYELAPGAAGPLTAELDLERLRAVTGTPLGRGQ